jgi:hypothetical protein
MTLTVPLTAELELRLSQEARRLGLSPAEYAVRLLDQHLPPGDRRAQAVALLQSWIQDGDAEEQRQTGDLLIQALDEDRPPGRKLFPPELEGVSW